MFILRTGPIVGAAYISGILGTGGAFTGVVKVDGVEVLSVGIDFLTLILIKLIVGKSYFSVLAGDELLVAPNASAVPKLAVAPFNRAISSQSVCVHETWLECTSSFFPETGRPRRFSSAFSSTTVFLLHATGDPTLILPLGVCRWAIWPWEGDCERPRREGADRDCRNVRDNMEAGAPRWAEAGLMEGDSSSQRGGGDCREGLLGIGRSRGDRRRRW